MMENTYVQDDATSGYELADAYMGSVVRVFLNTGNVLTGTLVRRSGKYIQVQDRYKERPAYINLDMVSSIV